MKAFAVTNNKRSDFDWRFLLRFGVGTCILAVAAEVSNFGAGSLTQFTASSLAWIWRIYSLPVTSTGSRVDFMGFSMDIVRECTGVHYAIIFIAAVLALNRHNKSYKAAGLFAGICAIFIVNILRLSILGVLGRFSKELFSFVHLYLWHGLFMMLVFLLWVGWATGFSEMRVRTAKRIAGSVISAAACFVLMFLLLEAYVSFIALLAALVFPLFSGLFQVPDRVVSNGTMLGYVVGGTVIYSETSLYFLNSAIFAGIAALTFSPASLKTFFRRVLIGALVMLLFHLVVVAMDWALEVTENGTAVNILLWSIVLVSMLAPLLSWACALRLIRSTSPKSEREVRGQADEDEHSD